MHHPEPTAAGDTHAGRTAGAAASATVPALDALLAHRGCVEALARSLARDAASADDLVQQTWLRAIESPPPRGAAGAGWLATVVRNLARDAHRRVKRRAVREARAARAESVPSTDTLVARAEAQRRLIEAVVALDEPHRSVVLLRFFEGLPPRRIAEATGVNAATVRTRLHRALALLRERLGDDGGRAAVLLLAGVSPDSFVNFGNVVGGAVVTSKQKVALAVVLALLAGAVVWSAGDVGRAAPAVASGDGGAPQPAPAQPRVRAAAEVADAPVVAPAPDAAPATVPDEPVAEQGPERLKVTVLRTLAARTVADEDAEPVGEIPVVGDDDREGIALGGGAMTIGGGSQWAPVAPKGAATWRGRVVDADGKPLGGADIFRVTLDASGGRASPTSFEFVAEVAKAASDGTFEVKRQPDGAYLVAANWNNRSVGPGGLDLAGAAHVEATGAQTVAGIEIRLPLVAARLGGLRGIVRDEDGAPVPSATLSAGHGGAWTGSDGRFEIGGLDAGDCAVVVEGSGFAVLRRTFPVRAGEVEDVEIRLAWAQRGTLEVAGRVTDDAGHGIGGMRMFLTDGDSLARYTDADGEGRYRFGRLPEALARTALAVMPVPFRDHERYLQERREDVRAPDRTCDFVLRRMTELKLLFRMADGSVVPFFNIDARLELPGEAPRELLVASDHDEAGERTILVPRGRLVMVVEGKGCRTVEVAIDVPDADGPKEAEIVLARE